MKTIDIFATGAAAVVFSIVSSAALAKDNVTFALDWIVNGTHAGYYVAREMGYYDEEDLDVELSRGFGSGDTVRRVGAGAATFGIADSSAVVSAIGNEDIPVRIVGMVFGKAPLGVIYLAESGIAEPKDLEGRRIARSASGSSVNMFPGFLQANELDRSTMQETVADANTLLPLLMSGQVDAVLGQTINIGRYQALARQQGQTALGMNYADYGMEAYGNAIIASVETVETNPDLVRRFVRASLRGIAYAIVNQEAAMDIMKTAQPEIDANAAREELDELFEFVMSEEVKENGLGYMTEERMGTTINNVYEVLDIARKPELVEVYTLEFLPEEAILPPQ